MTVYLVGGFLGSGKTTAILGAAKILASKDVLVGIVTNDQGRFLVDTEAVRTSGFAAFEVTGGCFCCNFLDFRRAIAGVAQSSSPKVIFAEAVGSCADIVATVLKPLAACGEAGREVGQLSVGPLSVFADIRLIRQRLFGLALPFSSDVLYIFDSQIEEAEILVLNKADLLPAKAATEVTEKAREHYPEKTILFQSSLDSDDLQRWIDTMDMGSGTSEHKTIPVDYDRYTHGEMELAWYDASLMVDLPGDTAHGVARRLIDELRAATHEAGLRVGHLKVYVRHEGGSFKASISEDTAVPAEIATASGRRLQVTINARAEESAERLRSAVRGAVARAVSGDGITWKLFNEESFHPARPRPFRRMP